MAMFGGEAAGRHVGPNGDGQRLLAADDLVGDLKPEMAVAIGLCVGKCRLVPDVKAHGRFAPHDPPISGRSPEGAARSIATRPPPEAICRRSRRQRQRRRRGPVWQRLSRGCKQPEEQWGQEHACASSLRSSTEIGRT